MSLHTAQALYNIPNKQRDRPLLRSLLFAPLNLPRNVSEPKRHNADVILFPLKSRALIAQSVKRLPADLAVPRLILAGGGYTGFPCTQPFIITIP